MSRYKPHSFHTGFPCDQVSVMEATVKRLHRVRRVKTQQVITTIHFKAHNQIDTQNNNIVIVQ